MIQFGPEIDRTLMLDTLAFAEKQVKRLVDKYPGFYPMYTKNGKWKHDGPAWTHWCDGFLPGMMWIFHRRAMEAGSASAYWMDKATEYSRPLEPRQYDRDVHDLGFIFLSTYHRWYQLERDPKLNDVWRVVQLFSENPNRPAGPERAALSVSRPAALKADARPAGRVPWLSKPLECGFARQRPRRF